MTGSGRWITEGFEAFARGTLGNGGQNLYVSRVGILQRIHQCDLNRNGFADLVICNSQPHGEQPQSYLYVDPLGVRECIELPSDGGWSGTVADLNSDGYDDVVIGMTSNGERTDLNAFIYYGSPDGFSERRHLRLPAPGCVSVDSGDFNGNGRVDLAMVCKKDSLAFDGNVRIFYQTVLGFEAKRFADLNILANQITVEDVDGDGYADLVVRTTEGIVTIHWGDANGIDPNRRTIVDVPLDDLELSDKEQRRELLHSEYNQDAPPLVRVVHIDGKTYVFVARHRSTYLVPVDQGRNLGEPIILGCPRAMAVTVGDFDGDGNEDIIVACREIYYDAECSWVYWGSASGFGESLRTRLGSNRACDVVADDLDGNGLDDIVLCQNHTSESFTADSLIYLGARDRRFTDPVTISAEDPRRAFIIRPPEHERPDLLFINHYSRKIFEVNPTIFYGGADGFSPERSENVFGVGSVEAICADLNDDGLVDLILANSSHNCRNRDPGSFIYLARPDGFSKEPSLKLPTTRCHGAAVGDVNRDGYLDLVFTGYSNPDIFIYHGGPDGFDVDNLQCIRMEHAGTLYDYTLWPCLVDLNNDGWLDLVMPQGGGADRCFVLWGGPDGYSMERIQLLATYNTACARAADLNGNGYLDLILGGMETSKDGPHDSFAYIYWNGPDGLREDRKTLLPANHINAMSVADFNNNGLLDLFVCSYSDGRVRDLDSYIYWNRAGRGFSATDRTRLFTHSASGCVAADFNEDGWVDIAVANHKVWGDQVAYSEVWWNGSDGFADGKTTRLPSEGPHGMSSVGTGNVADGGPDEVYTSEPFQLPEGANVTSMSWEADVPPKTWVRAQVRLAETQNSLDGSAWIGGNGKSEWLEGSEPISGLGTGRWFQYRLALGAINGGRTPRVTRVDVHYG